METHGALPLGGLRGTKMKALLPLAVAAVMGTATIAFAENHFSYPRTQDSRQLVRFEFVTSDAPATVAIYDRNGELLASKEVHTGVNSGVRIPLGRPSLQDATAVLLIDGVAVTSQPVRFER